MRKTYKETNMYTIKKYIKTYKNKTKKLRDAEIAGLSNARGAMSTLKSFS